MTHFKITGISDGILYRKDGLTTIQNGEFQLSSDAGAGLKFLPAYGFRGRATFYIQASIGNSEAGVGPTFAIAEIQVSGSQVFLPLLIR